MLVAIGIRFFLFYLFKSIYMSKNSVEFQLLLQEKSGLWRTVSAIRFFLNPNTIYYSLYVLFAFFGIFFHVFFFAFHLYEIMNQFQTCRIFIQSITKPYKQLILTFIFYNILVYEFSVLGYVYFWKFYRPTGQAGNYCNSMLECYMTVFDQTNKEPGGVGSFLDIISGPEAAFMDSLRVLYDFGFKFLVPIIMLSIVKGIIVDTFGALREKDQDTTQDMESRCFICGLEK